MAFKMYGKSPMTKKLCKASAYKIVGDFDDKNKSKAKNEKVQAKKKVSSLDAYHDIAGTKFANESASDAASRELAELRKKFPTVSGDTKSPR